MSTPGEPGTTGGQGSVRLVGLIGIAAAVVALTRYGVLWPILTSFALLVLALPILLQ
jgi:hypothetical protein